MTSGLKLGAAATPNWEEGIGEADVPPSPCRTIVVTDEIRAADEAQRAARDAERERFTWRPPPPLPESAYRQKARVQRKPVKAAANAFRHRPPAVKPPIPPPPSPPERTKRMPSKATRFEVLDIIPAEEMPGTASPRGRVSPFLPIYQKLQTLGGHQALPIGVDDARGGYAISAALRKMAEKDGKQLVQRRNDDSTTFYFQLTDKTPKE